MEYISENLYDLYVTCMENYICDLITESEIIVEKHEKELENERRNQNDGK